MSAACGFSSSEPIDEGSGGSLPTGEACSDVEDWDPAWVEFEEEVLVLVNENRTAGANCGGQAFSATHELVLDERLRCAARLHSLDMAERGFFDHVNPDGVDPAERVVEAGYAYSITGENIAAGQRTPEEVVAGWMASPGHCQNIMLPEFSELGIGYVADPGASFPHYWTQNFGHPR